MGTALGSERAQFWAGWIKEHRRALTIAGVAVAIVGAGVWFTLAAKQRKAQMANRALDQARGAAEAGNLALAGSDLSRLINTYRGTEAAAEASLLLGQLHLVQDQPQSTIQEMRTFLGSEPPQQFVSEAHMLLATALEQTGALETAGSEYEAAAKASYYKLVQADLWLRAGRAYQAAHDTANAVQAFGRVVKDYSTSSSVGEAQLRLAELGRYDMAS